MLPWQTEVGLATTICSQFGCTVERSPHAYEVALIKGDGIKLLLYPAKAGGGVTLRVRDHGSKNQEKARRVMVALKNGEGLPHASASWLTKNNVFAANKMPGDQPQTRYVEPAPHRPAAFINALSESHDFNMTIQFLQSTWNDYCELRAENTRLRERLRLAGIQ